ncbi:MAG TPA: ABC transporter ATP-binding protein [Ktedonobacterales bacterium]
MANIPYPPSAPPTAMAAAEVERPMVLVREVVKRYGRETAVNGVSFSIRPGEIFGILGPNGAGKTTTLEMIEGIRAPDSGEIRVDGLDVRRQRRAVHSRIGVQLQATSLFEELTVRETITLFGSFYPRALPPDQLLREVGLEEKARARPPDLSGGQRQRLALALALVNDPRLVFLDEPTTGLDPQSRRRLWETIQRLREHGKTVVLTTHFMDEAQLLCDRLAIMDHGGIIAQDTPAGLIARLGASATIECALSASGAAGPALGAAELGTLPGVTDARQGLERTLLYSEDAERTLVAVLQFAAARHAKLDHLQVHAPTLEDVFLKLTGRELRG